MAFALVANAGSGSGTTSAVDTTGADLLVAAVAYFDGAGTVTDSKGNTWTGLTPATPGSGRACRLLYCVPTSVGGGHTFSTPSGFGGLCVSAWSGVDTATPFDAGPCTG